MAEAARLHEEDRRVGDLLSGGDAATLARAAWSIICWMSPMALALRGMPGPEMRLTRMFFLPRLAVVDAAPLAVVMPP